MPSTPRAHAYSLDEAPTNSKSNGSSDRAGGRHRLARVGGVAGVDEQEAAAAGADQLAADHAAAPRQGVQLVDALGGHPGERLRLLSQCSCMSSA